MTESRKTCRKPVFSSITRVRGGLFAFSGSLYLRKEGTVFRRSPPFFYVRKKKGVVRMNAMRVCTRAGALFLCLAAAALSPVSAAEVLLPEQHVVASPLEEEVFSPGAVTVVRPEEMQGEQKSLPDLLKRVPGLHVVEARGRGAYTVASVRGSTSAQVAVYIDGMLANLGSESAVDLSAIPVDDVERIEVYRGYVPSRFNRAAMGGVINIVTRKPKGSEASLTLGVSSYGGARSGLFWSRPLRGGVFSLGVAHE